MSRSITKPGRLAITLAASLTLASGALAAPVQAATQPREAGAPTPTARTAEPAELIVKFKAEHRGLQATSDRKQTLAAAGRQGGSTLSEVRTLGIGATLVATTATTAAATERARQALLASGAVEYAVVNGRVAGFDLPGSPNDPRYPEQWDLDDAIGGINAPAAWQQAQGNGAVVAVIDTGITKHPDLDANVLPGYDMVSKAAYARDDDGRDANPQDEGDWNADGECSASFQHDSSWHGTHVAGTIAAVTDNRTGIAGIAPKAKIVPVRVLAKCGGSDADVIDAITWASGGTVAGTTANANPAKIANLSLGGKEACTPAYQEAIDAAAGRGMTIVTAAGNSHDDAANYAPGNCTGVVNVSATGKGGALTYYSNYGSTIALAAPGGEKDKILGDTAILSTMNAGKTTPGAPTYAQYAGTSMAAPHVAGVAGLLVGLKPTMTPAEVRSTLTSTARRFPSSCTGCGAGILDAGAAVAKVTGKVPDQGRDILTNGGFESGSTGWTATPSTVITTGDAAEGTHLARLNGQGRTNTATLSRSVTIPATSQATLSFKLKVLSDEITTTTPRDTLTVSAGSATLATYSNLGKTSAGYVDAAIDLTKYAGQTLTLTWTGKEDSWKQTTFQVDAVALKVR
ncbi:S8 family serine peptidase [Arsenicicoccus dermatophilus]|uniref:S8 family peptidase n=1 Tax=Arsenicicoccus dermatophilus TaxID=1076331 RepID=UPI003916F1F7